MSWLRRTIALSNHIGYLSSDACLIFVQADMALERTFGDFLGDPYGRVECSRRGEFPLFEALRLYPELAEGRVWKFERNKPSDGSKNVDQKRKSRVSLDYVQWENDPAWAGHPAPCICGNLAS